MSRTVGLVLVGAVALGLGLFLLLRGKDAGPAAADLTAKALDPAAAPADRERAALDLAKKGPEGKEALKRLLRTAPDPAVKASAVSGLVEAGAWDCVPLLLDALDDPSEAVRARAGAAVARFVGKDYGFKASAPPDERRAVARAARAEYEKMAKSPPPRYQTP
jgi:HEAT repeat protein